MRDFTLRDFIVDRKDTKGLNTLTSDDWIVCRGSKYQVKTVEAAEYEAGWVITAKELPGEDPQQTFTAEAVSEVECDSNAS